MTRAQIIQIIVEVLTVLGGFAFHSWKHAKTIRDEATRVVEERKKIEAERKQFESEKVSFLAEQSKFLVKKLADHSERMDESDKHQDQLRSELHEVGGKVEAVGSMYTKVLQKAKERRESQMQIEPGKKPDVLDQSKISTKKERT